MTIILPATSQGLKKAAEIIRKGGLVAFPTETVYGLGANALNAEAVKKIFVAKKRAADNPLIVHVSSIEEVYRIAEVNDVAEKLMKKFFPGPMTLVMKKKEIVPSITTGGLEKVAVRMPDHRVALDLIDLSGVPLAAPSANTAGRPSPTKVEHVIEDLGGRIDAIVDGGEVKIGIESTVLDTTTSPPRVLRPGAVSVEELRKHVEVEYGKGVSEKYGHYETFSPLYVFTGERVQERILEFIRDAVSRGSKIVIIAKKKNVYNVSGCEVMEIGERVEEYAKSIFSALREADSLKPDAIVVEGVEERGIGEAIMHRLSNAARGRVFRV